MSNDEREADYKALYENLRSQSVDDMPAWDELDPSVRLANLNAYMVGYDLAVAEKKRKLEEKLKRLMEPSTLPFEYSGMTVAEAAAMKSAWEERQDMVAVPDNTFLVKMDPDERDQMVKLYEGMARQLEQLNQPLHVKFARLHPAAKMPTRATEGSAGLDFYACKSVTLYPGVATKVDTGIALAIPAGYVGLACQRSGLGRRGVVLSFGVIDADYRGSVQATLTLHDDYEAVVNGDQSQLAADAGRDVNEFHVNTGDRVFQLLIMPIPRVELDEVATVAELGETERGGNGFGSSGK